MKPQGSSWRIKIDFILLLFVSRVLLINQARLRKNTLLLATRLKCEISLLGISKLNLSIKSSPAGTKRQVSQPSSQHVTLRMQSFLQTKERWNQKMDQYVLITSNECGPLTIRRWDRLCRAAAARLLRCCVPLPSLTLTKNKT